MRRRCGRARARLALLAVVGIIMSPVSPALAWNPLGLEAGGPWRWDTTSAVVWNPDGGPLGQLGNATANTWVADAFGNWQAVTTAVISYSQGGQIIDPNTGNPTDVTSANYNDVINADNGQNPIIYDNDRDIFDMLGTPNGVLGFAGVLRRNGATITKGWAVLQGDWYDGDTSDVGEVTENEFRGMMVHEFGHFSGLAHTEVNRGIASTGLPGCVPPTSVDFATMSPFNHADSQSLNEDDKVGVSVLYPTAAFQSDFAEIQGVLIDRDGVSRFQGANMILRPDSTNCSQLYGRAQGMQSGAVPAENGGAGSYRFSGLAANSGYTVQATVIKAGGSYPIDPPASLGGPEEYFNGANEDWFDPPDDPAAKTVVTTGAAGTVVENVDLKINNAGNPARVPADLMGEALDGNTPLDPVTLQLDDGSVESASAYGGTAQAAWINRFTPASEELPFQVQGIDILIWHSSVQVGRDIRLLVYVDENATGDPANATLVYTEDVQVQVVSSSTFNEYSLTSPPMVNQGEFYVGAYDLVADPPDTFIMSYDTDANAGRSFRQANSTAPVGYSLFGETWMIRARGATVPPAGSVRLTWSPSCNDAQVPGQDYGVYEGSLAALPASPDHAPIACSTGKKTSYTVISPGARRYWLVAPNMATREGSLGTGSGGSSRDPVTSCQSLQPDACP